MWCGFVIFVSWNYQPQNVRLLQEAVRIRQVIAFSVVYFPAVLGPLHVFYLDMWVTLVRKKNTDHAMFDHLLWKNHTERVQFFWFTRLHHLFRGGLQTADISQSWDLNPIKAAKINGLAMAEVGAKKNVLCWSSAHGTSRRHEPIEWEWLTIILIIVRRRRLLQIWPYWKPYLFYAESRKPLQIHLQQKASYSTDRSSWELSKIP